MSGHESILPEDIATSEQQETRERKFGAVELTMLQEVLNPAITKESQNLSVDFGAENLDVAINKTARKGAESVFQNIPAKAKKLLQVFMASSVLYGALSVNTPATAEAQGWGERGGYTSRQYEIYNEEYHRARAQEEMRIIREQDREAAWAARQAARADARRSAEIERMGRELPARILAHVLGEALGGHHHHHQPHHRGYR